MAYLIDSLAHGSYKILDVHTVSLSKFLHIFMKIFVHIKPVNSPWKCNVLLPAVPRVYALAGCYRLGIRALGYREHRFFIKTTHYNHYILQNQFSKLNF